MKNTSVNQNALNEIIIFAPVTFFGHLIRKAWVLFFHITWIASSNCLIWKDHICTNVLSQIVWFERIYLHHLHLLDFSLGKPGCSHIKMFLLRLPCMKWSYLHRLHLLDFSIRKACVFFSSPELLEHQCASSDWLIWKDIYLHRLHLLDFSIKKAWIPSHHLDCLNRNVLAQIAWYEKHFCESTCFLWNDPFYIGYICWTSY